MRVLKHLYWSNVVLVTTVVLWLMFPSSFFYWPKSVLIEGYDVTVERVFPLNPPFSMPIVAYTETVRPIDGATPCQDDNGVGFRYKNNGTNFATWNIEKWAAKCMKTDFVWTARWWVKLWGIIPLRPVEMSKIITVETKG